MRFVKGHGLGNDYAVADAVRERLALTPARVRALCDRHRGIGSDGVLVRVPSRRAQFGLRIFNPDGSEAEKSGNGLRIFGQYLFRHVAPGRRRFTIETRGGIVAAEVAPRGAGRLGPKADVTVDMGRAVFERRALPMRGAGPSLGVRLRVAGRDLLAHCVSVGNPHCVIPVRDVRTAPATEIGPRIERHPLFPRRVNVQFAQALPPREVRIRIWERGAGTTLSSGSSACAVAAVFVKLGVVGSPVRVRMPGGTLDVDVSSDFALRLRGPVEEVFVGETARAAR